LPGDRVCSQCHAHDRYATKAHHFHPEDSTGASCSECHIPAKNHMVVDARHDHGFRVPRPDQSVALGTPNACNNCHTDESAQWAADQVVAWYGLVPKGLQTYAPALRAAPTGQPEVGALLQAIAADNGQRGIARATAVQALSGYPGRGMLEPIKQGLAAKDPLRRLGALAALDGLGMRERLLALPLLGDDLKAVRTEAAMAALARVHRRRPGDIDILSALISYHSGAGQFRQALKLRPAASAMEPRGRAPGQATPSGCPVVATAFPKSFPSPCFDAGKRAETRPPAQCNCIDHRCHVAASVLSSTRSKR